ncbi:hypothetical protein OHA74_54190 [Streptomyces phaeochromogenes]|uniref:hypothetical protein n=1 Tax=Streptomyces phaeochromogenes TaxID=1923 RepID=UPI002E2C8418|nr:hypothetical protein [Streptomyces phaeochromogenes]
MEYRPPEGRRPGAPPGPQETSAAVARLPVSNAIAAVLIAVAALLGAIAVLLVIPEVTEALGTAVAITGSGFTLAARIAVPRRR